MKTETITAVVMLVKADPDSTSDQLDAIKRICEGGRKIQPRDLVTTKMACSIIGVSRTTLGKWVKQNRLTPIRQSRRLVKFDRATVEKLAYEGQ